MSAAASDLAGACGAGYPDEIGRAWVYYECLRRLGFDNARIQVGVARGVVCGAVTHVVRVALVLPARGKRFDIDAAVWCRPPQEFVALWDRFGDALVDDTLADAVLWAWWDRLRPQIDAVALVRGLMDKGIAIPCVAGLRS